MDQSEVLVDRSEDLSEALVAVTAATAVAITAAMAAAMVVIALAVSPVASVAAFLVKIFVNNKKRLKIYHDDVRFGAEKMERNLTCAMGMC